MAKKKLRKSFLYSQKRYWYHVSSTLTKKTERLIPWDTDDGFNRGGYEPDGKRICVSPSIVQCITAIPYTLTEELTIYRTKEKVHAQPPIDVFDSKITNEGWLKTPTTFIKIGMIDFGDVEKANGGKHVINQSASGAEIRCSGKVLKWWKRKRIHRFIKRT